MTNKRKKVSLHRLAVTEKLGCANLCLKPQHHQREKLLALRQKFIVKGGELLNTNGIARELKARRGGIE